MNINNIIMQISILQSTVEHLDTISQMENYIISYNIGS